MMASEYPTFPDDETLKQGLAHLLHCDSLEIVHRRPTENPRTFQSELIHCRLETGVTKQLLIKYSGDREHDGLDHRRGVEYEAGVYRNVIRPSGAPTVEFYGSCEDPKTGWTWLVIQHLEKASTINHFPELLKAAAHWIGAFHRATQPLAVNRNSAFAGGNVRITTFGHNARSNLPIMRPTQQSWESLGTQHYLALPSRCLRL